MFLPRTATSPLVETLPNRSFMRLKQRSSVVLPQPEGPISAVTSPGLTDSVMSRSAWNSVVPEAQTAGLQAAAGPLLSPSAAHQPKSPLT